MIFFPFDKRVFGGHELSKKFAIERSLQVGQISQRQHFGKNSTFLFADLLQIAPVLEIGSLLVVNQIVILV